MIGLTPPTSNHAAASATILLQIPHWWLTDTARFAHSVHPVKKSVWIFLLIVLLPAVVLGWLALRSADEQRFILERRTAELFQTEVDAVASTIREAMIVERQSFAAAVRRLLADKPDATALARDFSNTLPEVWKRKAVGFALGPDGKLLAPSPATAATNASCAKFLQENVAFLCNTQPAVVYTANNELSGKTGTANRMDALNAPSMKKATSTRDYAKAKADVVPAAPAAAPMKTNAAEQKEFNSDIIDKAAYAQQSRAVQPAEPEGNWSALMPATAEFAELTKDEDEGMIARFVKDKLDLIFWLRPPEAPTLIFGCLIEAASLRDEWPALLADYQVALSRTTPDRIIALLDDKARPIATVPAGSAGLDWKRPFVASEIGEAFPHWEAVIYLARPTALADSARGVYRTFAFLIAGAIALIAIGGWLVAADVRRQLALAQQKTDFVSNVSHELKTPLTSIRMFAELMHDRPQTPEKQSQFLRIISVESERLTRLINNVLDFAKLERKQRLFEKKTFDFHDTVSSVWENSALHLKEAGFTAEWTAEPGPYPIIGDADALAQILVNLISNAEKYSTERKEIELHTSLADGWVNASILDRGAGVPSGDERKIFEAFYRAHDSLNSGIQGSGLGLTLAQQIAAAHGGHIDYKAREGGGSQFTLRLPLRSDV